MTRVTGPKCDESAEEAAVHPRVRPLRQPAGGVATSHGRSTASNKEHSTSASTHGASIQCRPLSNVLRIPACGVKTQIRTAVELLRFEVGLG